MTRLLLRFDDICPTMNWAMWDAIEAVLDEFGAQPILAVVPDNQSPKLMVAPPNAKFWDRARAWQAKGWVIGQHGFRHILDSRGSGLVPWWKSSEFAGHPLDVQRDRIERGMAILRGEGLKPLAWVAPAHSFDAVTLRVLRELNLDVVSDGVNFRPYKDALGLVWIPQQPWRPIAAAGGTWTACFHSNQMKSVEPVRRLLSPKRFALMGPDFRFEQLVASATPKGPVDAIFESLYWSTFSARRRARDLVKMWRSPGTYV
ncbi:MAG TPA: DUF2334 domain-containing protein, partial [Candidatus Methylomirabilis sp.]|nr:DUF2334 domain-containing protein [Candidatus Methylomirabilis sp.]